MDPYHRARLSRDIKEMASYGIDPAHIYERLRRDTLWSELTEGEIWAAIRRALG